MELRFVQASCVPTHAELSSIRMERSSHSPSRRIRAAVSGNRLTVLTVIVLALGACGTRVNQVEEAAPPASAAHSAPADAGSGEAPAPEADGAVGGGAAAVDVPASAGHPSTTRAPGAPSTPVATPRTGGASAAKPQSGVKAAGRDQGKTSPASPAAPVPGPTPSVPGSSSGRSEILLGQVGTFSGPIGSIFKGAVTALQVWVKSVNEAGGLNGHPVRVFTMDDGGDPARSKANVQELVERRRVIAFIADFSLLTRGAHSQYLLERKIPVLGGEAATPEWTTRPNYFSVLSTAEVEVFGLLGDLKGLGKTKLAYVYCAESQECQNALGWIKKYGPDQGVQLVYSSQISVAQPDFTAECLAARNSGADVVFFAGDDATIMRGATSCVRQSYSPLFASASVMQTDRMAQSPAFGGSGMKMFGNQAIFPWFLKTGTPGIQEFATRIAKYAQSANTDGAMATGWASAKLLEAALRSAPGNVTSAEIFKGLWTLKNETLGGLIAPVSFSEGQPSAKGRCWFPTAIQDGKWVAPQGAVPRCTDRTL